MNPEEQAVSERAEAALKTNAEAYRLAQEALDMRRENERLRAQLDQIANHCRLRARWVRGDAAIELGVIAEMADAALEPGATSD